MSILSRPRKEAPVAIVVVGSHRSGTSALTGALALAGAGLPSDVLAAHPVHDARGCWESRAVVHLNDDVLKSWGGAWDAVPPTPADRAPPDLVDRARKTLAARYDLSAPVIVLKDPRISLLAPLWREALEQLGRRVVFVLMARPEDEVARSLGKRNGMAAGRPGVLWRTYMRRADSDTRETARVVVTYDELLQDWRAPLGRISIAAGAPLADGVAESDAIDGFLTSDLRRFNGRCGETPDARDVGPAGVYTALAAEANRGAPDSAELDDAWAETTDLNARAADGWDVRCCYNLFLGREPESAGVVSRRIGLDVNALISAFASSSECTVRIRDPITALARPRGGLFDRSPPPVLSRWAAERVPLTEAGRVEAAAARSWIALFDAVFNDPACRTGALAGSALAQDRFLEPLRRLSRSPAPFRGSPRTALRWTLVTGAPRSGTSLLRALLNEHPNVALLQEYGLTTLVDRIEAIVARPAPQQEDWDSPVSGEDAEFGPIATFYRNRPGRQAVTRDGGDLTQPHFHDVAAGLFKGLAPTKRLKVVGDKTPFAEIWEDVPLLVDVLPGLAIFVVLRNPLDVVRSSLVRRGAAHRGRDVWPVETVQEAAAQWVAAWRQARRLREEHAGIVHFLKYEDLCERPAEAMAGVFERLGLTARRPKIEIAALPPALRLHSEEEDAAIRRLFGPVADVWAELDCDGLLDRFDDVTPPYVFGQWIDCGTDAADRYLVRGFSYREAWGRWTDGPSSRIELLHGEVAGAVLVEMKIAHVYAPPGAACELMIRAGSGPVRLFRLDDKPPLIELEAQLNGSDRPGVLALEFVVARPGTPPGEDGRALGVGLQAFRVSQMHERERCRGD